jgi:hypothetical protein
MKRRHETSLMWMLAGAVIAIWLLASSPSASAFEQPDQSCLGNRRNEQATTGGHPKGIRATTTVEAWTGDCERVVSVAAISTMDPAANVEFGWSLGYALRDNGTCCTYFAVAELFQHWRALNAGSESEHNIRPVTGQTQITLTLKDGDGNGTWSSWTGVNGADQEGYVLDVDFSTGNILTNSERHTSCNPSGSGVCDSAWSHMWNEKRWLSGNADFTSWLSDVAGPRNNDPWYYYDHVSDDEHFIRKCGTSGC